MTGEIPRETLTRLKEMAVNYFGAEVAGADPLAGDASERSYVRLRHPGGAAILGGTATSSVGMILASPFDKKELPFINVQAHFRVIGLPVPEIYAADPGGGLLLLEDAGDRTLEEVWNAGGWEAARPFYEEAIRLLAALRRAPVENAGPEQQDRLALSYGFDEALFMRELHMTRRCAFERLCGLPAPEAEFGPPFAALAGELCTLPYALTHRDYHSRNLMARGEYSTGEPAGLADPAGLLVLDFQDARLGPLTYDLASLVFDSYVPLPEEGRMALVAQFRAESGAEDLFPDPAAFGRALCLTGLQRNLKAIGTFAYQKTERGNPRYLRHISLTAAHVRRHLAALPEWSEFAALLEPYICALEEMEKETVH